MILLKFLLWSIWVPVLCAHLMPEDTEEDATPISPISVAAAREVRALTFASCGIKGPASLRSDNTVLDTPSKPVYLNSGEESTLNIEDEGNNPETTEAPVGTARSDSETSDPIGVVSSLDWGVPTLNDTDFAEYAGETSPFVSRITYGQVSGKREFPWQVAMSINRKFTCGASLISDYHVLTAAHCVFSYRNSPSTIDLSLGDWDLRGTDDGHNLKVKVSTVIIHPSYNRRTLQDDVAVLKLDQRVQFTDEIIPICLPASDFNLEGEEAIVSGWGRNEFRKLHPQLHHIRARVVSNTLCNERWSVNGAPKGFIVKTMMCMDATNGDSCNAYSGGPSVYEYPAGSDKYVQVGIVAFGSGSCTDANLPGVYMRVFHYRDWIRQQMI